MLEIKANQELYIEKLLSFRGELRQSEVESVAKDMQAYIKNVGAKLVGAPITTTFAIKTDLLDVEVLMPIDGIIASTDKYKFKEKLKITNALVASYKGDPAGLQAASNQMTVYMSEHNLLPITTGYNITRKVDILNPENTEIDVYVGISPNIL